MFLHTRFVFCLLLIGASCCVLLSGCDPKKPLAPPEKLTIAVPKNINPTLVKIADARGFFREEGLDVLKKIHARYPGKPVVLVTGYRNEMLATIEQGMHLGACTCLYKPLEIDKLMLIIDDISRRKRNALLGEPFNCGVI